MDGSGFDAWTRRRFGMAAGGLAASVAAMTGFGNAEAKKKCRKFGDRCGLGRNSQCCCPLQCGVVGACCKAGGQPCKNSDQCCSGNCFGDFCVCKSNGQVCTLDAQCCSGACQPVNAHSECVAPA